MTPISDLWEQTSFETSSLQFRKIRSRVLQSKRRTSCRRKPGLFARSLQVLRCFVQSPYRSNIQQHLASWCLLIRQKPITVIIDASLDELTGATIIITTAITDRLSPRLSGARGVTVVHSPSTRRRCSSRISSAMLVRESRTSSANGAFGRHDRHDDAGMRLLTAASG